MIINYRNCIIFVYKMTLFVSFSLLYCIIIHKIAKIGHYDYFHPSSKIHLFQRHLRSALLSFFISAKG